MVTNSDSQISKVIALNPSFTTFSSKTNIRDLFMFMEFRCTENAFAGSSCDYESAGGRFFNEKQLNLNNKQNFKTSKLYRI